MYLHVLISHVWLSQYHLMNIFFLKIADCNQFYYYKIIKHGKFLIFLLNNMHLYYYNQQVPDLETYHAVAFEPLIGNEDAVHHMLLFGCDHDLGTEVGIYPSYYFTFEVTRVTRVTYCNWLSSVVMCRPLFIVN